MVDTSDEWIVQRTGIRERHIAADGELTSDLAIARRARGARRCRRRRAVDRPDRARDLDARQYLSGRRRVGAGRRSASPTAPPSTCRRSAPASSSALATADGLLKHRRLQARAGDRRGDLLAHPRLDRPHHLRAVRRRRRRGRAGGAAAAGHARGSRRAHRASALRRPPQGQALCRRRAVLDRDRRPSAHGRPRGLQARRRR